MTKIDNFEVDRQINESRFPSHLRPSNIEHHLILKKSLCAWIAGRYMQQKIDETLFRYMKVKLVHWMHLNGFDDADINSSASERISYADITKLSFQTRFDDLLFRKGDINIISESYDDFDVVELQDYDDLKFAFCEGWGIEGMVDSYEHRFRESLLLVPIFSQKKKVTKITVTANDSLEPRKWAPVQVM